MARELEFIKEDGEVKQLRVQVDCYSNNHNLCILLITLENGAPEIFAYATMNLGEVPPYHAYVDINKRPELIEFIQQHDLGTFTGTIAQSGYNIYPLYKFNRERLKELCPEYLEQYEQTVNQQYLCNAM